MKHRCYILGMATGTPILLDSFSEEAREGRGEFRVECYELTRDSVLIEFQVVLWRHGPTVRLLTPLYTPNGLRDWPAEQALTAELMTWREAQ